MNGTLERTPNAIGIVSPETLLRAALRILLEKHSIWRVTAEAASLHDGIEIVAANNCNIIVVSYDLPLANAADFLLELAHRHLRARVLVLHRDFNDRVVDQLRALGAKGLVSTGGTTDDFTGALSAVAKDEQWWPNFPSSETTNGKSSFTSAQLRQRIKVTPTEILGFDGKAAEDPLTPLSNREREIFLLLASGMTNVGIAKKLFLSPRTVETHRARIVRKLGLNSNGQLIRFALRNGLAPL